MRRLRWGIGGVVALAILALDCSTASAARAPEISLVAKVKTRSGQVVRFETGSFQTAVTVIGRDRKGGSSTAWATPGRRFSDDRRVRFRMGKRIDVSGRYVPKGRATPRADVDVVCIGEAPISHGFIRGTFRVQGIPGVAGISKHRVPAKLVKSGDVPCHGHDKRPDATKTSVLSACRDDGTTFYGAIGAADLTVHFAFAYEQINKRITVFQNAFRQDDAATFQFAADSGTGTVSPGAPFDGTGYFADGDLTGDLIADVTGSRNPLPLTPARGKLEAVRGSYGSGCGRNGGKIYRQMKSTGVGSPRSLRRIAHELLPG